MPKTIAITGATGYVGRHLIDLALREGWSVIALSRTPPEKHAPNLTSEYYDLGSDDEPSLPAGTDALVHLAARTDAAELDDGVEERAAALLLRAALTRGVRRVVFASSQGARPDSPTAYGRTKSAIEHLVLEHGGTVVRLGMVCGGEVPGGMYRALVDAAEGLPVIPRLIPGAYVQPIGVDDASRALLSASTGEHAGTHLLVAHRESVRFDRFLGEIARQRLGRRRVSVPVPVGLIAAVLGIAERLGRSGGLTRARLASLVELPSMDTEDSLVRLGLTLEPWESALQRPSEWRRHLIREGRSVLRYAGDADASPMTARHYVRAVEAHLGGHALDPASRALAAPRLWAAVEARARRSGDTRVLGRFDLALALAEALAPIEFRPWPFLARLGAVAALCRAGAVEVCWRVASALMPRTRPR